MAALYVDINKRERAINSWIFFFPKSKAILGYLIPNTASIGILFFLAEITDKHEFVLPYKNLIVVLFIFSLSKNKMS